MRRNILIGVGLLVLIAAGAGAWFFMSGDDGASASAPISAVPLAQNASAPAGTLLFQIVPDQSEARFTLSEELRGAPKTVVGATKQVAGQLSLSPSDLSAAQVGTIQINARTFATDSTQRDRAIRNFILNTDSYELITFKPTGVSGLSGAAELNKPLEFQLSGDLTIRDVTKPVVFTVSAKADSESKLSGNASATVNRGDFGLTIPNVPFVANVGEQVQLEIDFVAEKVQ